MRGMARGIPDAPIEAWERVGHAVLTRRVELGYRTRQAFSEMAGLTIKTLGEIERGDRQSYDPATLVQVERCLSWPQGTIVALLSAAVKNGDPEPSHPTIPTVEAELSTLAGLHAWLHRMEPAVLGALLHRSGLDFEAKWELVNAERERAVAQLRDNWQRLAEEIRAAGGTVDPDTWPSWLEAPALVDEIRKKQGDG
jgi:hypothetical protein